MGFRLGVNASGPVAAAASMHAFVPRRVRAASVSPSPSASGVPVGSTYAALEHGHDFSRIPTHADGKDIAGMDLQAEEAPGSTAGAAAPAATTPATPSSAVPTNASPAAPAAPPSGTPSAPTTPAPAPAAPATTVTFPSHIRAASSPAAMADRIPPRVDTAVAVAITGSGPVEISVQGSGGGNGSLTLNGAATANLAASGNINLRGIDQTDVGKGGNLKLVAKLAGTKLAESAGFSVSSIPQNYTDTFVSLMTGASRGFVVQDGWSSDSGTFADLDQTEISELVEYGVGTGCFAGAVGNNSGYLPGNQLTKDTHSRAVASLTSAGKLTANQVCEFNDKRSSSTDIPMTRSGYLLTRENKAKGTGFEITTSKNGASATAKGVSSAAGAGSITKTQAV